MSNSSKPRPESPYRSRGLTELNQNFTPFSVESAIRKASAGNEDVLVLELGFGNGKALLELRKIFPSIHLYGINKKRYPSLKCSDDLKQIATHHKIFSAEEACKINLPKVFFYDAEKLHFRNNSFNIIYSQMCIPYIKRKDILIEECWRILKPNGTAFLNIDHISCNHPDFMQDEAPRFIIFHNEKKIAFSEYFSNLSKKGFDIRICRSKKRSRVSLILHKNASKKLRLNLHFDSDASFDLYRLGPTREDHEWKWGYRSAFKYNSRKSV